MLVLSSSLFIHDCNGMDAMSVQPRQTIWLSLLSSSIHMSIHIVHRKTTVSFSLTNVKVRTFFLMITKLSVDVLVILNFVQMLQSEYFYSKEDKRIEIKKIHLTSSLIVIIILVSRANTFSDKSLDDDI